MTVLKPTIQNKSIRESITSYDLFLEKLNIAKILSLSVSYKYSSVGQFGFYMPKSSNNIRISIKGNDVMFAYDDSGNEVSISFGENDIKKYTPRIDTYGEGIEEVDIQLKSGIRINVEFSIV